MLVGSLLIFPRSQLLEEAFIRFEVLASYSEAGNGEAMDDIWGMGHSTNGLDEMMTTGSLYDLGFLGIYCSQLAKLVNEAQLSEN